MFNHLMLELFDGRGHYGEDRWVGFGMLYKFVGAVIYTEREGETIRIIFARKANSREVKVYEKYIQN